MKTDENRNAAEIIRICGLKRRPRTRVLAALYALAFVESGGTIDWPAVNQAIIRRFGHFRFELIKNRAWRSIRKARQDRPGRTNVRSKGIALQVMLAAILADVTRRPR